LNRKIYSPKGKDYKRINSKCLNVHNNKKLKLKNWLKKLKVIEEYNLWVVMKMSLKKKLIKRCQWKILHLFKKDKVNSNDFDTYIIYNNIRSIIYKH
jgi:hypothetical protein